jgi:hypothetical protein
LPPVFYFLFSNYRHIARTTGQQNACLRGGSKADNIVVRVNADTHEDTLKLKGTRPTIMKGRPIKGYIDLDSEGRKDLRGWVELAPRLN